VLNTMISPVGLNKLPEDDDGTCWLLARAGPHGNEKWEIAQILDLFEIVSILNMQ